MIRSRSIATSIRFGLPALFLAALASAQPASLLLDINPTPDFRSFDSTFIRDLRAVGDRLFFLSDGENAGSEVWVSDGTPAGTEILRDICPGPCSSEVVFLRAIGNVLFWSVRGESGQRQLWRSDGTRPGTFPLTGPPLSLGTSFGSSQTTSVLHGALYFVGCASTGGGGSDCDLWKSDGTVAGTEAFSTAPVSITWLEAGEDRLYYIGQAGSNADLWTTDGTAAGTRLLKHFPSFDLPNVLIVSGSRLYFWFAVDGQELWTSDGTVAGTKALTSFEPSRPLDVNSSVKAAAGRIYFFADDGSHDQELWRSDGTPAGTVRLTDFEYETPFFGDAERFVAAFGSATLFVASDEEGGSSLWLKRNDSAPAVRFPGACPDCRTVSDLVESGGRAYFLLEGDFSSELWVSNGTAAGTRRLTQCPSSTFCQIESLVPSRRGLLFLRDSGFGNQIWSSDGTAAGTGPLTQLEGVDLDDFDFQLAETAGGDIYFIAQGDDDNSLWVRDRAGRTRAVRTFPNEVGSSRPDRLTPFGDRLLFTAQDVPEDFAIWSTTGTAASTAKLAEPPIDWEDATDLLRVGNLVYFQSGGSFSPNNLWRTDGTDAGTFVVAHLQDRAIMVPFQGGLTFFDGGWIWHTDGTVAGTVKTGELPTLGTFIVRAVNGPNGLYLELSGSSSESGLWLSDGTTSGTRKFSNLRFDSFGSDPDFTIFDNQAFFISDGVWRTDGTAAGTISLTEGLVPSGSDALQLTAFQGKLYFFTANRFSAEEEVGLWRTDGTRVGLERIANFPDTQVTSGSLEVVASGDRLFFTFDDGVHGKELWQSNGAPGGTTLVRDLVPGAATSNPSRLTDGGGRLYFSAVDLLHGVELWQSDGTSAGTRLVQDIAPQAGSSEPRDLTVAGGNLYFTADDGIVGREIWVLPLAGPSACQPSSTRLCLGGRYAVEAVWQDFSGHQGVGHAAPLTSDTGTFWFFDPSNLEVVLKVLDGRGVNDHVWVFYGALSNVQYTLTVTDTQTGLAHRYRNPSGELASVADTHAFGPLGASAESVTTVSRAKGAASPLALVERRMVASAATGACAPSSTRLCLNESRFAVEVAWKDFAGNTGAGQASGLTADTGWFWFFDPANVELVLKVLDGTTFNGHHWVFYGALSSVEYTVTVTDTQTGEISTYRNPSGTLASVADIEAF